jgi:hypothetical protein
MTKNKFGQTPKLTENFDQLKMSSEFWSSDCFPIETFETINSKYCISSDLQ